jgi:2-furoate---CoA ligase
VNLALSLLYAAERTPAAEALVDGELRLTHADLLERAARLAGGLADLGVRRGDRLAAVLDNRHETAELYWAAQWLGATFVPLSWRAGDAEIEYCIDDCGARAVAIAEDGTARVGDVALAELLDADEHSGALDLDERAESLMLYTSGTTGRPKGVPRSHRADRAGGLSQVIQHGLDLGDRTLGVMPLYHTMGMHSLIAMSLVGGCFVVQRRWDPDEALDLIERERLTALYLAPTLYHDLVGHPGLAARDVSSVRALAYAGAAMTRSLVERCSAAFRPRLFVNHYGSTEIYTFSVDRDQAARPGCAGRPALNARLRLGDGGEIECQLDSDEAFAGYWNRPDADEKAIRDGWYRTGDVGHLDDDGNLWIDGRVDDMIISGGENIHPLEVEDVLAVHPGVAEVAVVGAADDRLGQRVVAIVVGTATEAELDAHCLASPTLARFKRPREYRFVDELPKSPSGKILRRLLREQDVHAPSEPTGQHAGLQESRR